MLSFKPIACSIKDCVPLRPLALTYRIRCLLQKHLASDYSWPLEPIVYGINRILRLRPTEYNSIWNQQYFAVQAQMSYSSIPGIKHSEKEKKIKWNTRYTVGNQRVNKFNIDFRGNLEIYKMFLKGKLCSLKKLSNFSHIF